MYTKISLNDFEVLVRLPVDFSDENEYPIFIGISGGNQSVETVMYSANVYFNTSYFQNYIQIIPINNNDRNFKDYSADEIDGFINAIMNYFTYGINKELESFKVMLLNSDKMQLRSDSLLLTFRKF